MFCDYQLFWHQHNQRPPLMSSVSFSQDSYVEKMADDGSIVQVSIDVKGMQNEMKKAFQELRNHKTPLFQMFKANT